MTFLDVASLQVHCDGYICLWCNVPWLKLCSSSLAADIGNTDPHTCYRVNLKRTRKLHLSQSNPTLTRTRERILTSTSDVIFADGFYPHVASPAGRQC